MPAVRTTRIEIFGFGRTSGERENWVHMSRQMQRMLNRMWQIWLVHHAEASSADLLRKHLDDFAKWKTTKQGTKPKWPCNACEKTLSNKIYHTITKEFPDVNARTRVLVQNKWQGTLTTRKAANGSLPGWVSILFGNESIPSFTRPQPFAFDHENGKLSRNDKRCELTVRIERLFAEAGTVKKSLVETCELMTGKRKAAGVRKIIDRIIDGEYGWKGSSLLFDRGKWYALLSYQMPDKDHKPLDSGSTLYVVPAKNRPNLPFQLEARSDGIADAPRKRRGRGPWLIKTVDAKGKIDRWLFGGEGKHIEYARRAILDERSSRKEHYRWAGSAQKGNGRQRADAVWTKLSSHWKNFVKRYNHEVSRRLVNMCVQRGIGRIVYCQPRDSQRDKTYLATVGNRPGSAMLWDFFQMGTLLAYKCDHEGITYEKHETKTPSNENDNGVQNVRRPAAN